MTEAKTQPTDASVEAYVAAVTDAPRREDCRTLIALMSRLTGEPPVMWGAGIVGFGSYHYTYASGRQGDACLLGFAARKADLTLYVVSGFEGTESILAELGTFKKAKACLYVKRLSDVDPKALERLLMHSMREIRRRYP